MVILHWLCLDNLGSLVLFVFCLGKKKTFQWLDRPVTQSVNLLNKALTVADLVGWEISMLSETPVLVIRHVIPQGLGWHSGSSWGCTPALNLDWLDIPSWRCVFTAQLGCWLYPYMICISICPFIQVCPFQICLTRNRWTMAKERLNNAGMMISFSWDEQPFFCQLNNMFCS
jgi:hypothetical protein